MKMKQFNQFPSPVNEKKYLVDMVTIMTKASLTPGHALVQNVFRFGCGGGDGRKEVVHGLEFLLVQPRTGR